MSRLSLEDLPIFERVRGTGRERAGDGKERALGDSLRLSCAGYVSVGATRR